MRATWKFMPAAFTLAVLGGWLSAATAQEPLKAQAATGEAKVAVAQVMRTADIIGLPVRNQAGENLGKIDDLVIDMKDGDVHYAALSFGGIAGIGAKLFAVPWQALRRRESPERDGLIVRKSDLKIRRFEEKASSVTLFCVDASGSAAVARLAEAKGAVERLLAQAYVARSEVALIAFRGSGAELLLPPTRSLTRARRALAELPGGGGTPLAAGASLARASIETSFASIGSST